MGKLTGFAKVEIEGGAMAGTIQALTFTVRFVSGGSVLSYSTTTTNSPKYKIFARVQAL